MACLKVDLPNGNTHLFLESNRWGHHEHPTLVVESKQNVQAIERQAKGDWDKVSIKASKWHQNYLSTPFLVMLGEEPRKFEMPSIYNLFMEFPVYSPQHIFLHTYSYKNSKACQRSSSRA